jgi:hypothetical protein
LPRGLGEDPLSRKRRSIAARRQTGATGSVSATVAVGVEGPGSSSQSAALQPSAQGIPGAPSYNEVFFQRREDEINGAGPVAYPDAVEVVTAPHPIVETAPPATSVEVPVESVVSVPREETREPVAPAPLIETTPDAVEANSPVTISAPSVDAAVVAEPPRAPPETQKGGFFNRIFGKFRK